MTDRKADIPVGSHLASTAGRLKWKLVAGVVLLTHLIFLAGLDKLLPFFGPEPDQEDAGAMAVQMVMPSAPPPPLPAMTEPVAQPPGIVSEQELQSQPPPADRAAAAVEDFRSDQDMPPAVDLSSRVPTSEELPRVGGVAMTLWWGDYTEGHQIGRGAITLSFPAPNQYEVRLTSQAMSWASLIARKPLDAEASGTIGPGGFRPSRYAHRTPFGKEEVSLFDYENRKITYSSLKEPISMPNGVQDRLSFMIQLAWMLKANPEQFSIGQSVMLPMAGRNKVEDVSFTVLSDQDIVLPGGVLVPALHISSVRQGERFKGQIDVWFDRTDRLLPVRIRLEESRGQIVDMLTVRE